MPDYFDLPDHEAARAEAQAVTPAPRDWQDAHPETERPLAPPLDDGTEDDDLL